MRRSCVFSDADQLLTGICTVPREDSELGTKSVFYFVLLTGNLKMATSNNSNSSTQNQVVVDYGPDSGGRIKGLTVVKQIVVGNIASYFGEKRKSDGHTHKWTVYLKPYLNEDYSNFIKKVEFKLVSSYDNPNRIISEPPYEVTETGWGAFEIPIKIYFVDPIERPVTLYHQLKLCHITDGDWLQNPENHKLVTAETYDEIVFQEPSRYMKSLLDNLTPWTKGEHRHETDFESRIAVDKEKINDAKKQVKAEIEEMVNKLNLSQETLAKFRLELEEKEGKKEIRGKKI